MTRVGQVWMTRHDSIVAEYEPCVVVGEFKYGNGGQGVAWKVRPLERLHDPAEEYGVFESQFKLVERGRDDTWVKSRLA